MGTDDLSPCPSHAVCESGEKGVRTAQNACEDAPYLLVLARREARFYSTVSRLNLAEVCIFVANINKKVRANIV